MHIPGADADALVQALGAGSSGDSVVAVLVAERSRGAVPRLVECLRAADMTFFGGVFPAVLEGDREGDRLHEEGLVAVRLPSALPPLLVRGLDLDPDRLPTRGTCAPDHADGGCTVLVLVDGLSDRIGPFLRAVFHQFGNEVSYLGGGAGSLDLSRGPCLFTAEGFVGDAAVLAFVPRRGSIGVRHGWRPIMGPFVATRTRRNVIEELNWRPAFSVYEEVVAADVGRPISPEAFFDVARGYPFGIQRAGDERVVRDPIALDGAGGLVCVGDVPENAVLEILKGEPETLVRAAGEASRAALEVSRSKPLCQGVVFDCISRAAFLHDAFEEERRTLTRPLLDAHPDLEIVGALSLGEIASSGLGTVEFLNKTVVVGLVHEVG